MFNESIFASVHRNKLEIIIFNELVSVTLFVSEPFGRFDSHMLMGLMHSNMHRFSVLYRLSPHLPTSSSLMSNICSIFSLRQYCVGVCVSTMWLETNNISSKKTCECVFPFLCVCVLNALSKWYTIGTLEDTWLRSKWTIPTDEIHFLSIPFIRRPTSVRTTLYYFVVHKVSRCGQ